MTPLIWQLMASAAVAQPIMPCCAADTALGFEI